MSEQWFCDYCQWPDNQPSAKKCACCKKKRPFCQTEKDDKSIPPVEVRWKKHPRPTPEIGNGTTHCIIMTVRAMHSREVLQKHFAEQGTKGQTFTNYFILPPPSLAANAVTIPCRLQ